MTFNFLSADIARWSANLAVLLEALEILPPRPPVDQLIKSVISSRTYDTVSQAAFDHLKDKYDTLDGLANARAIDVERVISDVTYVSDKARYVIGALQRLRASRYGFDLDPLRALPLATSLNFLEMLPGIGRKVSASILNASTLAMPVMIVDGHVLRILRRLGAVHSRADHRAASELVTSAMPSWSGRDFLEFHVSMKRLGQVICHHDQPECRHCPLSTDCQKVELTALPFRFRRPS